jgi:sugar phosphate isomerase/epimerase
MNPQHTRRDFLKWAALLPLSASCWQRFAIAAEAGESPPAPQPSSRFKLSVASYSFSKLLNAAAADDGKAFDLFRLLDFCATLDVDALESSGYFFPGYPKIPSDEYLNRFKRHAFDLGLGISGTGVKDSLTVADKAKRQQDVQLIKQWVEVAARIGAPVLRVFADTQLKGETWKTVAQGNTHDQVEGWIADDLRECAEYAGKFGIIIGIQNHGDFLRTGDDLVRLVKRVGSDWCGPIIDTGYFKSADMYADIARAGPHAVDWLFKQRPFGGPTPLDLDKLLRITRSTGFRGYVVLETLPAPNAPYDPLTEMPAFVRDVRTAIVETG